MEDQSATSNDQGDDNHPSEASNRGDLLAGAKGAIARDVGRSGTEHWAAFEIDSEKGREVTCLRRWADETDAWSRHAAMLLWHGGPGMGEHDVKEYEGRFWKATKDGSAFTLPRREGR